MKFRTQHTYTTMDHAQNPAVEHLSEGVARACAIELSGRAQGETTVFTPAAAVIGVYSGGELRV